MIQADRVPGFRDPTYYMGIIMAKTFSKEDVTAAVEAAVTKASVKATKAETKRIIDVIKATAVEDKAGKTLIKTILASIKQVA